MWIFAAVVLLAVGVTAQPIVRSRFDSCVAEAHDAAVQQLSDNANSAANRRQHQIEQLDVRFQNAKFAVLRNAISVRDSLSRNLGAVPNDLATTLPQLYSQMWAEIRKAQKVAETEIQKPTVDLRPLVDCFVDLSGQLGSRGLTATEFRQFVEQLDSSIESLNRFASELANGAATAEP